MGALFSRLSRLSAAQRVGATVFLAVALYQYRRELRRMMGLGARRKRLAPGDRTPGSRGLKATATAAVLETRGGDTTPTTTTSQRSPAAASSPNTTTTESTAASSPVSSPRTQALETEARFEQAQDAWPEYQELASDDDKKRLYGLYKFVLEGAASAARAPPSGSKDPILKWKWEAWSSVTHATEREAKQEYADLVFEIGARGKGQEESKKGEKEKEKESSQAAAASAASATPAPAPAAATPHVAPLPERFEDATQYIKNNGQNLGLGTEKLLKLYAFFKQAKKGDNKDSRPSMWSGPAKIAKWDAYEECKGMGQELAMQKYIDEVTKIDKNWEGGVQGSSNSSSASSSGKGSGGGMGMNVSTMSTGQHSNDGTTSVDWKAHVSELHAAASAGDREKVRALLSQNNTADMLNSTDDVGMTALMYACDGAHVGVVEELLAATGIDLTLKESQDGMTALHYAMCTKRIATALIAAGADVNASDNDGTTCISMCDDKDQGDDRITRAEVAEALTK